ncbi:MAG: CAP domain-containing protein [Pyrinomonadaceae bacterium]
MIFKKLHPHAGLLPVFRNGRAALAVVALPLLFCANSLAQSVPPRPVARLIGNAVGNPGESRTRKASPEAGNASGSKASRTASPSLDEATAIERRAFEKTNQARGEKGLSLLVWDSELCRLARAHSESMGRLKYFSHETPEGSQLKDRARRVGILHFRVIAENIAYNKGYQDPGAFAVERWLLSSAHSANIFYNGFQASAIGSYVSTDGSVYLTQVFITR